MEISEVPKPTSFIKYDRWFPPFDVQEFATQWQEFKAGKRNKVESSPYHLPDVGSFKVILDKEIPELIKGQSTNLGKSKPGFRLTVRLTPLPGQSKQELQDSILCLVKIPNALHTNLGVAELENDSLVYQNWYRQYYTLDEAKVEGKPRLITQEELDTTQATEAKLKISQRSRASALLVDEDFELITNINIEFEKVNGKQ